MMQATELFESATHEDALLAPLAILQQCFERQLGPPEDGFGLKQVVEQFLVDPEFYQKVRLQLDSASSVVAFDVRAYYHLWLLLLSLIGVLCCVFCADPDHHACFGKVRKARAKLLGEVPRHRAGHVRQRVFPGSVQCAQFADRCALLCCASCNFGEESCLKVHELRRVQARRPCVQRCTKTPSQSIQADLKLYMMRAPLQKGEIVC